MRFEQFKNTMDSYFGMSNNQLNNDWLFESVEMIFNNTSEIQEAIENTRIRPYNPPFMALKELIFSTLKNEGVTGFPTTKQIERYFNLYGLDYKEFLSPLTQEVVEIRGEF